jgi:hypothetical protein
MYHVVVVLVVGEVVLVASSVPPVMALYQRMELALAPGVAFIVPEPHTDPFAAAAAGGVGLTVRTTVVLVGDSHIVVVWKLEI